jgi:hypothetical protein
LELGHGYYAGLSNRFKSRYGDGSTRKMLLFRLAFGAGKGWITERVIAGRTLRRVRAAYLAFISRAEVGAGREHSLNECPIVFARHGTITGRTPPSGTK